MAASVDERAKKIKLYKNGDPNFLGKDFVLNRRKIRTWDSFLNTATVGLKANYPVRAICTPNHGHRVQSLDDIEDSKQYVALGYGKFKNVGYTELENHVPRKDQSPPRARQVDLSAFETNLPVVRPVEHSKRYQQTSGRFRKVPTDVLTIFVYANGKELVPARRFTLTHNMMRNWEAILTMITERVDLPSGAARRIYTMSGELVTDPRQFENGAHYIAVGAEVGGLKLINYGQTKPDFHTSPKAQRKNIQINYPRFGSKNRRSRASDNSTAESNATDNTLPGGGRGFALGGGSKGPSPAADRSPARQGRPRKKEPVQRRGPPPAQDDSVFHAKAVKHQMKDKNQREVDFDKDDEEGVFKARGLNRETSGAREVEETRDTHVDLPIDQVEAEEVKDELIELDDERPHRTPTPKERTPTPRRLTPLRTPTPQKQRATPSKTPTTHRTPTPKQLTPLPQRSPTPQKVADERTPTPQRAIERRTPTPAERTPTPKPRTATPRDRTPSPQAGAREATPEVQDRVVTPNDRTPTPGEDEAEKQAGAREATPEAQDRVVTPNDRTPTPGEDEAKKQQAAVKIQASYRGYRTRKEMQRRKEQKLAQKEIDEDRVSPVTDTMPPVSDENIEAGLYETDEQTPRHAAKDATDQDKRNDAAITIQKNYKGYKVRKEYQKQQSEHQLAGQSEDKPPTPAPEAEERAPTPAENAPDDAGQSGEGRQTPAATDDQSQEPTQTTGADAGQSEERTEN